jgi:aryl-alcohol dehydrogenase
LQTGAGTTLNALKPWPGSSFALYGCGAVGLAALMGAKIAGCDPIIAIDTVPERLALARELGATQVIDARTENAQEILMGMGGMDFVVEASGIAKVIEQAAHSTKFGGAFGLLGVTAPGTTITLDLFGALSGRRIIGVNEGESDLHGFIPSLVDRFMDGEFPIDKLTKFYTLETLNDAVADSSSGATVKPIIRMPHG